MVLLWTKLEDLSGHDAAWALLEECYAAETGLPLPETACTDRGKPYFIHSDYHFSLSHTDHHAFCCLSEKNVGIDAEEMNRTVSAALADKILSPREKAKWESSSDKEACLLRFWVLKEAYAKLTGKGLGSYLYETDFDPDDPRIQCLDGCYVAVLEE